MVEFSVIIPLYNCEKYIEDAVLSIINQTYPHFELIIIDDGCNDNSIEKLVNYLNDERIRIIHQKNKGLFHTRLVGLKYASKEYCVFLDSDDTLGKNALEVIENELVRNEQCDVVMYRLRRFFSDGVSQENPAVFPAGCIIDKNILLSELYSNNRINNLVMKAFRRQLFNVEELEDYPRITLGEDTIFTLAIFENAKKVLYTNAVLYNYRMVDGSMSRSIDLNAYASNKIITKSLIASARRNGLFDKCENRLVYRFLKKNANIVFFGKYKIEGSEDEYKRTVNEIANDPYFKDIYCNYKNEMPMIIRLSMSIVIHKRLNCILILKKILTPFMIRR